MANPATQAEKAKHNLSAIKKSVAAIEKSAVDALSTGKPGGYFGRLELTLFIRHGMITGYQVSAHESESFVGGQ